MSSEPQHGQCGHQWLLDHLGVLIGLVSLWLSERRLAFAKCVINSYRLFIYCLFYFFSLGRLLLPSQQEGVCSKESHFRHSNHKSDILLIFPCFVRCKSCPKPLHWVRGDSASCRITYNVSTTIVCPLCYGVSWDKFIDICKCWSMNLDKDMS